MATMLRIAALAVLLFSPFGLACGSTQAATPLTCVAFQADCDGAPANGCETDLRSSHDHCGRCDRNCAEGGCSDGLCSQVLFPAESTPLEGLALDANAAYYTLEHGATVRRALKDGSSITTIATVTAGLAAPGLRSVATEGGRVYWITPSTASGPAGTLHLVVLNGGAVSDVATDVLAVTSFAGGVFYLTTDGTVWGVPVVGGVPAVMAAGQGNPVDLAVDVNGLLWANEGSEAANFADGSIVRLENQTMSVFSPSELRPAIVGVGSGNAVWSGTDGRLRWKKVDQTTVPVDLSLLTYGVAGIQIVKDRLYYLAAQTSFPVSARAGVLYTIDLKAESLTAERQGPFVASAMALDEQSVFGAGFVALWKVAR